MKATSIHPFSQEEMMAYLDGELTPQRMLAAGRHLEECDECQRLVGDFKQVSETLMRWEVEEALSGLPPRVGPWRRAARFWLRPNVLGLTACVLTVVVAVALVSGRRKTEHARAIHSMEVNSDPIFESRPALVDQGESVGSISGPPAAQTSQAVQSSSKGVLIVRTAELTIVSSQFEQARASMEQTAAQAQGYVAQLLISSSADNGRTLDATLRIPAAELQTVIERLRGLGRLESESQADEDVTQRSVDLNAQLSNLATTETRLLQILREKTGSLADVLQVEEAVDRTRGEIEVTKAEQETLSKQLALASLRLRVSEQYRPSLGPNDPPISTRLRNAAIEGYRNLVGAGTALALFLLWVGPTLLVLIGICFFPARWLWKRRRHSPALP